MRTRRRKHYYGRLADQLSSPREQRNLEQEMLGYITDGSFEFKFIDWENFEGSQYVALLSKLSSKAERLYVGHKGNIPSVWCEIANVKWSDFRW